MDHEGHIQLIVGPMFAGKSTELLRRIRRYSIARKRCVVVKFAHDTRYSSDNMATHDKSMLPAKSAVQLGEMDSLSEVQHADVIGVDEGQFFPDLVEYCEKWANAGKIVIVSALDATYQRKPFKEVCDLIPLAEMVTKLTAVCMVCTGDAHFSKRISADTGDRVIGGADKYISVCRHCFLKEENEEEKERQKDKENRRPVRSSAIAIPLRF
jgi:thymidine kinase